MTRCYEYAFDGARGTTTNYGDGFEFRPYGSCTVMFVTTRS